MRGLVNSLDSFDIVDIFTPDNQTVDGERWLGLLEEESLGTIKLQLRPKMSRQVASPPIKPVNRQEDAVDLRSGPSSQAIVKTMRVLEAGRREDYEHPKNAHLEGSSDSDSSSTERN